METREQNEALIDVTAFARKHLGTMVITSGLVQEIANSFDS